MNAYSGDIRRTRLAITGAAVFVSLLLALHVLRPDVDPTWTVISAYGLGSKWWLMSAAFAAMAAGCAALAVQLSPDVRSGWMDRLDIADNQRGWLRARRRLSYRSDLRRGHPDAERAVARGGGAAGWHDPAGGCCTIVGAP